MNSHFSYKVTPPVRKHLAKPIGTLFPGTINENVPIIKNWLEENTTSPKIICVGDVVSHAFLSDSVLSDYLIMCVIDEQTKRGKIQFDTTISDFQVTQLKNPAGLITPSAIETIKSTLLSDVKSILIVDGEEDLLVLPVILSSPEKTLIVYGQPPITDLEDSLPAGLVVIEVNSATQNLAQDLLDQFEKV